MSCQKLVELVTDYLEGTLAAPTRAELEEHLALCRGCEIYVEQMRMTIGALRMLSEPNAPAQPSDELLIAFRARTAG